MSRIRLAKIAPPGNPPASCLEIFYSTPDSKLEAIDESGNIATLGGFGIRDYRFIKMVYIFQGTTGYTPSTGVRAIYVECIGAGGAGGGATAAASQCACGGGGGAGGYAAVFIPNPASSYMLVVGTGGVGGTGIGGTGGNTTFGSPSVCTANGGQGAQALTTGTTFGVGFGGSGGAGTVGDLLCAGGSAQAGYRFSGTAGFGGVGGASMFGGGGRAQTAATGAGAGTVGGNYGGGGAGACSLDVTAYSGGSGANGLIRVWEFA